MNITLSQTDKAELLDLLKKLIAIPSVNTGANQQGNPEREIADFIAAYLTNLGMELQWLPMPNGRPNLLGRWPQTLGKPAKEVLMLSAHMDTVNVEGMTIDPFTPNVQDGRIFGRGACDTKGALASYLWTLKAIAPHRDRLAVDVQFLATCDEENGCVGSTWLADNKLVAADYMIVGEPTASRVAVAHRGSLVLEFHTTGKSAHASVPDRGDNAVYQMSDLIQSLRKDWLPRVEAHTHPVLGKASASVTMIDGGLRFNVIPDHCRIVVDIRTLPDQPPGPVVNELEQLLAPLRTTAKVTAKVVCQSYQPALYTDPKLPFVTQLLAAAKAANGHGEPVGVAYFADSSEFARLGCQCVLLGPGDIAQAHGPVEFLDLDQLHQSTEILLKFFSREAP